MPEAFAQLPPRAGTSVFEIGLRIISAAKTIRKPDVSDGAFVQRFQAAGIRNEGVNDLRVRLHIGASVTDIDITRVQQLQRELNRSKQDLETAYEGLQSTNEELQTINAEMRERSDDLNRANGLLESILEGARSGVVVRNRELHVLAWNHRAGDL